MLVYLCLIAGAGTLASWVVRRPWFGFAVAAGLLTAIAYLLFFYTGTVARIVLDPGPPNGAEASGFYIGIQHLQAALLETYLAVMYLSALSLGICFSPRRRSGREPEPRTT